MAIQMTLVVYYIGDEGSEKTVQLKIPIPAHEVTLGYLKKVINRRGNFRFYFRSADANLTLVDKMLFFGINGSAFH